MRTNDEIVDLLESLRQEKQISISELARRVDMAKSAVSRYFNRTREFPLNRINEFAKALGTTPEFILGFPTLPTNAIALDYDISYIPVPVLGTIACGEPILVEENIEEYRVGIASDLPKGTVFFLKAKGDSMEPKIPDGSYVMIREQPDVENGEIAAVQVNGDTEATLKRVRKVNDHVILEAINEAYAPYIVDKDHPARIIGKGIKVEFDL